MRENITVIGAGTMGSGIAQIAAEAGFNVTIVDTEHALLDRGIGGIRKFLERKAAKGTISKEQMEQALSRLKGSTDMKAGVADAVMVVEAVFEKLGLKKEIFSKLDALCPPNVILASNTSTLSITEIAGVTKNPERVIGTHYFSPVPLMKLVEVIRGEKTTDTVADRIHSGAASAEAIDQAMKLGCNWPMGPNEIMDLAGVDVCYFAIDAMYQMTGHEGYKPSPLFKTMLEQNRLGRKSGQGFYTYNK